MRTPPKSPGTASLTRERSFPSGSPPPRTASAARVAAASRRRAALGARCIGSPAAGLSGCTLTTGWPPTAASAIRVASYSRASAGWLRRGGARAAPDACSHCWLPMPEDRGAGSALAAGRSRADGEARRMPAVGALLRPGMVGSPVCAAIDAARLPQDAVILAELRRARDLAALGVLTRDRAQHVCHGDRVVVLGGGVGGIEHDVADVAAGKGELARQEAEIDVGGDRCAGRKHAAPQPLAPLHIGQRELDDEMHAAR